MCRLIPPISQNLPPSLLLNNPLPLPLFSTNLSPSTPISSFNHPTMSDRQTGRGPTAISRDNTGDGGSTLLRWIQDHAPNSSQVVGFLSLVISAAILLILTWLTVSGVTLSLIVFGPLLLITSPVWVPVAAVAFVLLAGVASVVGGAVAAAAVATWLYRYFTGRHPVGSDRVDLARSRIADTATHVKDYAIECGGYLQSRIKDAAPGA